MKEDKRIKRKVRRSYIVSTISIALVLFLLGSVGYMLTTALGAAHTLRRSITLSVELENNLSDDRREALRNEITATEITVFIIVHFPRKIKPIIRSGTLMIA